VTARARLVSLARRASAVGIATLVAAGMGAAFSAWSLASPGLGHGTLAACSVIVDLPTPTRNVTLGRGRTQVTIAFVVTVETPSVRHRRRSEATLSVGTLPPHVTAAVAPERISVSDDAEPVTGHVTLSLDGSAAAGTFSVTLTARRAASTWSVDAAVTVLPGPPPGGLSITPPEMTAGVDKPATFCVAATSRETAGLKDRRGRTPVVLPQPPYAVTGLPPGATFTVRPPRHRSDGCVRLLVAVGLATPPGAYPLQVSSGVRHALRTGKAVLHVDGSPNLRFTISGNLQGELAPGLTLPLDLRITNPNAVPIQVTSLTVSIDHLDDAHAAGCPVAANYTVSPFSGTTPLQIPAGAEIALSELGLLPTSWPQVSMLETDADQTPCLGALLTLAYSGSAAAG
jgi:hypothetical protein